MQEWFQFPELVERIGNERAFVISDDVVGPLVKPLLPAPPPWLEFLAGEASKTMATYCELVERVSRLAVDRQTTLVAVGGGVVGDTAGFVAASYLRGLPLVQVPTTLVAMVDSSLGGKVGVDLPAGKNLVGAFYPATRVLVDPELLRTLPAREWAGGMAEVIKHALLDGEEHLAWLESLTQIDHATWPADLLKTLVERSSAVKLTIVAEDPFEKGVRAHLNLGHTLGHALETASHYSLLTHGEAVSIGLLAALRLSGQTALEVRIHALLQRWSLPTGIPPGFRWPDLEAALRKDKKNRDGQVRFVLLDGPGHARVQATPLERIQEVVAELSA